MANATKPEPRTKPDYYIGRFTKGAWVEVTRESNGNGIHLEFVESVKPYAPEAA